jgi:hypothetical protein
MTIKNTVTEQPGERVKFNLSREDALLIHCARLELTEESRQAVKDILAEGVGWDFLLEKAGWHRISCLVSYHLRNPDLNTLVPQRILQQLQNLNYVSLGRNVLLQDSLSKLLSAFSQEGIPVIVLKGAALLGSVYQDISLRPMSDLDILIHPEDLDRAEAIALRQGYAQIWGEETRDDAITNGRHLPNLIHREKQIMLEIHHHIVGANEPYHFDLSGFWARAVPLKTLGAGALTLSPEDLLIHLSIKFLLDRHYNSGSALGQLCDISEVIKHYGDSFDWNLLEKAANDYGIAPGLHFALYSCKQLLHTQVSASVLQRLRPPDFNPELARDFLLRRVLDKRAWLAHDLVTSQLPYSRRRALWAIVKRFFCIPKEVSQKYSFWRCITSFYFGRMKNILPRLWRALLRPKELKQDLLLDRWLHDLFSPSMRGCPQGGIGRDNTSTGK